jgi:uncharacterized protein DUF6298/collagenase-like protein with putative collagen-binding domain
VKWAAWLATMALTAVGVGTACGDVKRPTAHGEPAAAIGGPLRPFPKNPRYFTDGTGKAVYLTGSHVWWNLVGPPSWINSCERGVATPFDYEAYLDRLVRLNHNFIRLWAIEFATWKECGRVVRVPLHPWLRTGPGKAVDGRPRFDLRKLNPAYFKRLRDRVAAARARGLYVSIMLFEGWGAQFFEPPWNSLGHPFNRLNNVNRISADRNGDGSILEIYTMSTPRVRRIQDAYVRKVVDTVSGFDNVLFEVANESGSFSTAWQYHMIDLVKRREAKKRHRHPVGMTFQHGDWSGAALFRSRAEWVAPKSFAHLADPPAAPATKVVLSDTDHHCGVCGDGAFVWKTFTRGYNPILMDPLTDSPALEEARVAMGRTRSYAMRIDLASMAPRGDLCSTGYCLVNPGREYLVYQPTSGQFSVDLRAGPGQRLTAEWMDPASGKVASAPEVAGGAVAAFTPPFRGPAVLYLRPR